MANPAQTRSKSCHQKLCDLIVSPTDLPSQIRLNPCQSSAAFTTKDLADLHNLVFLSWISAEELLDVSVHAVDHLNACVGKYSKYTDGDPFKLLRARIAAVNKQVLELQQKDQDEEWEVEDKQECESAVMITMVLRLEVQGMVRDVLQRVVDEAKKEQVKG